MNLLKSLAFGFFLAASLSLSAATNDDGAVLITVGADSSRAVLNGPDGMTITAERMTFERGVLRCSGEVTMVSGNVTVRARDAAIEMGDRRVFILNPNGVRIEAGAVASEVEAARGATKEKASLEFSKSFPATDPKPRQ
jgi:hypothetical protein